MRGPPYHVTMDLMTPVERFFRPGQNLFKEGENSHCMYLVRKGAVSVRKTKGSAFVEIARIHTNEVIGELSFFDRQPRSATAVAITEVEALEITFDALDKIYGQVPDYMKSIIACVVDRLRKANDTIRRLQKNVIGEGATPGAPGSGDEADVEALLAATADIATTKPSGTGGNEGNQS